MEVPFADLPGDTAHGQLVEQGSFSSGDMDIAPLRANLVDEFMQHVGACRIRPIHWIGVEDQ